MVSVSVGNLVLSVKQGLPKVQATEGREGAPEEGGEGSSRGKIRRRGLLGREGGAPQKYWGMQPKRQNATCSFSHCVHFGFSVFCSSPVCARPLVGAALWLLSRREKATVVHQHRSVTSISKQPFCVLIWICQHAQFRLVTGQEPNATQTSRAADSTFAPSPWLKV